MSEKKSWYPKMVCTTTSNESLAAEYFGGLNNAAKSAKWVLRRAKTQSKERSIKRCVITGRSGHRIVIVNGKVVGR